MSCDMLHMWRSHVTHVTYEWVWSQTGFVCAWMSRVALWIVPFPMWPSHVTHVPYEWVIWTRHVSHTYARTGSRSCECTRAGLDMCLMTRSHFTYLYLKLKPPVEGRSVLPPQNLVTLGAQVCKSLLQVSFTGLFYRSLLQVFFAGFFLCKQVSFGMRHQTCDIGRLPKQQSDSFTFIIRLSPTRVKWLMCMCDTTHSYLTHTPTHEADAGSAPEQVLIWMIWRIHMCDMTRSHV